MRMLILLASSMLLISMLRAGQNKSQPTIPQTFPPAEPDRPHLQVDQPPTVVHGDRSRLASPAQVRQDADELAKLAQSIPAEVDKATKGQLPRDLPTRLKQIERLSKHLRREIVQ